MTSQIKTETKPDINSEAEFERKQLIVKAKLRSAMAEDASLKTCRATYDARKMTAELAVSMADTKEREDALMVEIVGKDTVLDVEVEELIAIAERYDDCVAETKMKNGELAEMIEGSKRVKELIDIARKKVSGGCCLLMTRS